MLNAIRLLILHLLSRFQVQVEMKFTIILFVFVIFGCTASPQLGRFKLSKFGDRINPKLVQYEWSDAPKQEAVFHNNFNPFKWHNHFDWLKSRNWLNPFEWSGSGKSGKSAGVTNGFSQIEIIIEIISKLQAAIDNGQRMQIIEIVQQLKREILNLRSFIPSKNYLYIVNIFGNLNKLQQLAKEGDLTDLRNAFAKFRNSSNPIGRTAYNRNSLSAQIQIIFTMMRKLQSYLSSGRTKDASLLIKSIVARLQKYLTFVPASIRSFFRSMLNLFVKMQLQVSMGHTQSINSIFLEIITLMKRMSRVAKGKGGGYVGAKWGGHSGLVKGAYKLTFAKIINSTLQSKFLSLRIFPGCHFVNFKFYPSRSDINLWRSFGLDDV